MTRTHLRTALPLFLSLCLGQPALRAATPKPAPVDPLYPNAAALPNAGESSLTWLAPDLLELRLVSTKATAAEPLAPWDLPSETNAALTSAQAWKVNVDGKDMPVAEVAIRRELLYAAFERYDIRTLSHVFVRLSAPTNSPSGKTEVRAKTGPQGKEETFLASRGEDQWHPALHINQVGYVPSFPKQAFVGMWLGPMGEWKLPATSQGFEIIDTHSGKSVFKGTLTRRPDQGFNTPFYQEVWQADFTPLQKPGLYRLRVVGLGSSSAFTIAEENVSAGARSYALGMLHQRCGVAIGLPETRFAHGPCHTTHASVPTPEQRFTKTNDFIKSMVNERFPSPKEHPAPKLEDVSKSLYPFVRTGTVDVSGGHHDAGDYSKYMTNSAGVVHYLTFAADVFPGAATLDNLGLPESGDGKSDLLQLAAWEADYISKMQDDDGAFYFLVYPINRKYEGDVLPDHGDPQVVFPKTLSATAAAVGALAEIGSSPAFVKAFPKQAAVYAARAQKGYAFLTKAITEHGLLGASQKISHYGLRFGAMDELSYAAAAMFAATGEKRYEDDLKSWWPVPDGPESRVWGWINLFEYYGAAARVYCFADVSHRPASGKADPAYLARMRQEIKTAGDASNKRAASCAYGLPLSSESKRFMSAGWYWGLENAYDSIPAALLGSEPEAAIATVLGSVNYEQGSNPLNTSFVTGLGQHWIREIVHQYSTNDWRVLPPSGIPYGNLIGGPFSIYRYKVGDRNGLNAFFSPELGKWPLYDRNTDSFNTSAEFVVPGLARMLAAHAWLMGRSTEANKPWKAPKASIVGLPAAAREGEKINAQLKVEGLPNLEGAQIVWEVRGNQPFMGERLSSTLAANGPIPIEAEVILPGGRRVFAASSLLGLAKNAATSKPADPQTLLLLNFDDTRPHDAPSLETLVTKAGGKINGVPPVPDDNVGWNLKHEGASLRTDGFDSEIVLPLPALPAKTDLKLSFWLFFEKGSTNVKNVQMLSVAPKKGDPLVALRFGKDARPAAPSLVWGQKGLLPSAELATLVKVSCWQKWEILLGAEKVSVFLDGQQIATQPALESGWAAAVATAAARNETWQLTLGNFVGCLDEVRLERVGGTGH
jgi:hypothetical protein